jgi:hypothetical protein
MKTTSNKSLLFLLSALMVLTMAFVPASQVTPIAVTGLAMTANSALSVQSVTASNDSGKQLARISAGTLFDFPVIQQPSGSAGFVSTKVDTFTQFGMASSYGSLGVLAHNYLAGKYFGYLYSGSVIKVTFTDGSTKNYTVSIVKQYQALSPESAYSQFLDLNNSGQILSSTDLFLNTFGKNGALVLQTCIDKNGNSSWGRLFIIAYAS